MLCVCNQLFCVHSSCHSNENNMSDMNIACPMSKVHMWDIMLEGKNTWRFLENQVCQWLSIRMGRILECLSLQSNLYTKSKKWENLPS